MNKWLILSAIIILEGAAERFRKTHGKFNYCKWTVGNGRYKLDGGGHSFGKCKNKCIERGDECNYMTFFHGTGYCHQFKSCNMPSLRKDGGATIYIKEAGTGWTMTEKIWNDGQCPNIGGRNGKTLRQCKQLCANTAGCTAINYSPTVANGACIFRKCGNAVPKPKVDYKGYNGYHMDAIVMDPEFNGHWGDWDKKMQYCGGKKGGGHAVSFRTKVEANQGAGYWGGDDSALNSICLVCSGGDKICSKQGPWGDEYNPNRVVEWDDFSCPGGYDEFAFKWEKSQGRGVDDTAANDIQFRCKDTDIWVYANIQIGMGWGSWWGGIKAGSLENPKRACPDGHVICGLKTRVEKNQNSGDDTALNGVKFDCCPKGAKVDKDDCGRLKDELSTATCKEMLDNGKCAEQIILSQHLCKKTCNPHICNQ